MDASLNLEGGIHCFMQHSAIREPGFHLVGVHVVAAGKQFHHSSILLDLILVLATQTNAVKSVVDRMFFICRRVSARFLHGFCTVSKRAEGAFRCKIRQRVQKFQSEKLRHLD